ANGQEGNGTLFSDSEINFRNSDLSSLISELQRHSAADAANRNLMEDVSLSFGVRGEPSSSSLEALSMERQHFNRDSKNKRPKVQSLLMDWGTNFCYEVHHASELIEDHYLSYPTVAADETEKNADAMCISSSDIRMDLTDDLLHMVFSFLDHSELCRAAIVCKQWREASTHEDFWRCLNFEGRYIPVRQFEEICRRYPNASVVNLYGASHMYSLLMKAVSSLRNLEVLSLGKGLLDEPFFHVLPECQMLRSLTINDATLGNGFQEIVIYHERLHDLQIMKCRLLRVSIR
ncbi:hypothetical protein M569_10819, partial [Genlisea aurea]